MPRVASRVVVAVRRVPVTEVIHLNLSSVGAALYTVNDFNLPKVNRVE